MTSNNVPLILAIKMTFRKTLRMTLRMTFRMAFKTGDIKVVSKEDVEGYFKGSSRGSVRGLQRDFKGVSKVTS